MSYHHVRDHYLPPDHEAYRRAEPVTGRLVVIAPTRAACETIELAIKLHIETVLERDHGPEIREFSRRGVGFGIVAGTGTGKTLSIRLIAEELLQATLRVGVVNREREATKDTPTWNVVIVTTGIARRWFQSDLIDARDTLVVDEIHQTSAELELCLALGKRVGCRFVWLSATVDPDFYAEYLDSEEVLETSAFDPAKAATVRTVVKRPHEFLEPRFLRRVIKEERGVAVFLPTRAEVEDVAEHIGRRWPRLRTAFYHGGEPIAVIRAFLEGQAEKPFLLAMTAAGQSAINVHGLDTVVIYDARYANIVERGRNVLTRQYLGANEILQMAGRVHGRVQGGEAYILSDRDIDFDSLVPTPPVFQLAGDSERIALTAAALGVNLEDLELPVPLDRGAYRAAVTRLAERGIIENGRLTDYGRDVEAMPVDRPWGELLVLMEDDMTPYAAVAANIDSLYRMTREQNDVRNLVLDGSDHLSAYNIYADAVNRHGAVGQVHGLPRHVFDEGLSEWAEARGVLIKVVEDVALGMASVYRTLELPLPDSLPMAGPKVLRRFRELVTRVIPFDLVIDENTASGESVRVGRGSMCNTWGAVAGNIRYFSDRNGNTRGAIEGTNLPFGLIKQYARRSPPSVEFFDRKGRSGLYVTRLITFGDFQLDRSREPLRGPFPDELADSARDALTAAILAGTTPHPMQQAVRRALDRLGEYWRRAAGTLPSANPAEAHRSLREQLELVNSWEEFLAARLTVDVDALVPEAARERLDALPTSAPIRGDRAALDYEIENGQGIVRLRLREGQARRLREKDLPVVDRPLRFTVVRGKRSAIRSDDLDDLQMKLLSLPAPERRQKRRGGGGRRKRRG